MTIVFIVSKLPQCHFAKSKSWQLPNFTQAQVRRINWWGSKVYTKSWAVIFNSIFFATSKLRSSLALFPVWNMKIQSIRIMNGFIFFAHWSHTNGRNGLPKKKRTPKKLCHFQTLNTDPKGFGGQRTFVWLRAWFLWCAAGVSNMSKSWTLFYLKIIWWILLLLCVSA